MIVHGISHTYDCAHIIPVSPISMRVINHNFQCYEGICTGYIGYENNSTRVGYENNAHYLLGIVIKNEPGIALQLTLQLFTLITEKPFTSK